MAFAFKSLSFSFILLLCVLFLLQISWGIYGAEKTISCDPSMKVMGNRKLLVVNGLEAKQEVLKIDGKKSTRKEDQYYVGWELRAAPLGPDPLHHHGADPKKPRTP
uniref:protein CLAVATA 3 n=1 Tax=Erigeron canadensis TaxID=72917 RepID=UPI001CB910B0|nr:protein CLAVATA 3 [Erigeron canadensis]